MSAGSSSEFLLSGMWCFVNELNEGVREPGAEIIELLDWRKKRGR